MKLIDTIRSSLHHKVMAAFLIVGIIPYLLIIIYFTYLGRQTILKQKLETYTLQAKRTKSLIQSRLFQLEQEILFLSKLELFDDMISGDIDHRISRVLEQKSGGLEKESITLLALSNEGKVIASSHPRMLEKNISINFKTAQRNGTSISGKNLLFFTRLKASFEDRSLGFLVAIYPLENLKKYIVTSEGMDFVIKNDKNILISSTFAKDGDERTTVIIPLERELKGYDLIYSVTNDRIFSFINRFMFYLTLLLLVGIAIIVILSRRLTKEIVMPIMTLTNTAKNIINTKRYDLFVESSSTDETSDLARAFNKLVETTDETLKELDSQSALHMRRFVDLTDMFNHITRVDDKDELTNISIRKLRHIVPYNLSFIAADERLPRGVICLPIKLRDFGTGIQRVYGYLVVDKKEFDDRLESRFFNSVVSMIALQIERIDLIAKIKSASNAKTSFISNMSHEFRTPLNAIIGFSQYLITYESLSDDQLDTVSKIERSALHLLGMINDILDIAKIESGKIEIDKSTFNLFLLLKECEELIAPMAEEKNLTITGLNEDMPELTVYTDAKLMKQVVINLLSNAVKFTQKGGVDISVKKEARKILITISDTGIGIAGKDIPKVFNEFVQLQNANQVKHKGTGLGLSLSARIIQALGGELLLKSEGAGLGTKAILILRQ